MGINPRVCDKRMLRVSQDDDMSFVCLSARTREHTDHIRADPAAWTRSAGRMGKCIRDQLNKKLVQDCFLARWD